MKSGLSKLALGGVLLAAAAWMGPTAAPIGADGRGSHPAGSAVARALQPLGPLKAVFSATLWVALLDSQARADTAFTSRRRRGLIELSQKGQFMGVTPRLLPLFLASYNLGNAELVGTVQAMAESVGKDAFIRQQKAIMGRSDLRPYLHEIACPTLVLAGRDDALTPPPLQEEMAGAIPRADLVILSGSGHLSTIERPEGVNAALRTWLSGV